MGLGEAAAAIRAGRATSLETGTGYTTDMAIRAAHLAALPLAKRAGRAKELADRMCDIYGARPGRSASIEAFAQFCESLDE